MRQAQIFWDYVELVKTEGEQSRQSAAKRMGVALSTAIYHLDKAVRKGELERYYTWRSKSQTGFMYRNAAGNGNLDDIREAQESQDFDDETSAYF